MYRWSCRGKRGLTVDLEQAYQKAEAVFGSQLFWCRDNGDAGKPTEKQMTANLGACGYATSDPMDDHTVAHVVVR